MRKAMQLTVFELEEDGKKVSFSVDQAKINYEDVKKKSDSKAEKEKVKGELADLVAGILEEDSFGRFQ